MSASSNDGTNSDACTLHARAVHPFDECAVDVAVDAPPLGPPTIFRSERHICRWGYEGGCSLCPPTEPDLDQQLRDDGVRAPFAHIGRKDDEGKSRLDLLPFAALTAVGHVLAFGAKKYGPNNWRFVDGAESRYVAAALRHISAFALGERVDADSGQSHLAHAAASLLFLLELEDDS